MPAGFRARRGETGRASSLARTRPPGRRRAEGGREARRGEGRERGGGLVGAELERPQRSPGQREGGRGASLERGDAVGSFLPGTSRARPPAPPAPLPLQALGCARALPRRGRRIESRCEVAPCTIVCLRLIFAPVAVSRGQGPRARLEAAWRRVWASRARLLLRLGSDRGRLAARASVHNVGLDMGRVFGPDGIFPASRRPAVRPEARRSPKAA